MFISTSEYSVLESQLKQTFDACDETKKATLYVMQRESGFLFLALNKKYVEVRCNLTGRKVKKKFWNDETKEVAKKLLAQHHISKTGMYVMYFIIFGLLGAMVYSVYDGAQSNNKYKASFTSKTRIEKSKLLNQLGEGDLIKTGSFVYKIKRINKKQVVLYRGNKAVNPYGPIKEGQQYNTKEPIKINTELFWKQNAVNNELIMQILNK